MAPADGEAVRALCRKAHGETFLGDIPFSDAKFDKAADRVLSGPRNTVCLVAEKSGQIVGMAWASAGEYLFGDGAVLTTVHTITIDTDALRPWRRAKTFLRLVKGIRIWSETRGAKHVLIHVTTGRDLAATDKLLRAAGAKCVGGGHVV